MKRQGPDLKEKLAHFSDEDWKELTASLKKYFHNALEEKGFHIVRKQEFHEAIAVIRAASLGSSEDVTQACRDWLRRWKHEQ